MTLTFDKAAYINLLADFTPQVITSEAEYDRALTLSERLIANRTLTSEESKFLALIVTLIEDYEQKNYPMSEVTPHAALLHLMEYSGTKKEDLIGTIGDDRVVSEIIEGKRPIDPVLARAIADRFKVSPSLFV